jgi:predicted nucleotidyltransferase
MIGLFSTAVYVSMPTTDNFSDSGICVVEFNASFNASNSVDWINNLSDCKGKRIDIVTEPDMQKKHKIVVVPTIIIFNEGEEIKRFQANIMMQLEATEEEVQEVVDEILMDSF